MAVHLDALEELVRNRDALLKRLVVAFERDVRIVGAWLSGSFGRGEADEWSDLDLHVGVEDGAFDALGTAPGELFALAGEPLLVQGGFPSDSVPGGKFWLVIYPGPVEIDWNVGPVGLAAKPAASLTLVEKRPIRSSVPGPASTNAEIAAKAQAQIEFFWAMAPIACKYAGRGHTRLAIEQCGLLRRSFLALWRSVNAPEHLAEKFHQNRPMEAEVAGLLPRFSTTVTPLEALAAVQVFCGEVERCTSRSRGSASGCRWRCRASSETSSKSHERRRSGVERTRMAARDASGYRVATALSASESVKAPS